VVQVLYDIHEREGSVGHSSREDAMMSKQEGGEVVWRGVTPSQGCVA
jgi:hypothetical protein